MKIIKTKPDKTTIFPLLMIVVVSFWVIWFILNKFILPIIAIYKVAQPNPDFKIACVQDYGSYHHSRYYRGYWQIDNQRYVDNDVHISATLAGKYRFPIDEQGRKLAADIRNQERECYRVSYIEVVDWGFFRQFYLYEYLDDK